MNAKNAALSIAIFALITFISFTVLFFLKLNTTVSNFSGSDLATNNQFYYTMLHGRPFQVTIYLAKASEFYNPYPYLNVMTAHAYFLSLPLVGFFYTLWPGINTMYSVFIIFNFIGFAFFTFKIIQRLSPSNAYLKSLVAFSVFLLSGILRYFIFLGYPLLLCGPFMLAAYYFLISGKRTAFFLTIVSLCLIQDDLTMFAISFLIVLLIFESKYRRAVYPSLVFCTCYFIAWNFIVQPLIKYDLMVINSMVSVTFFSRVKEMFDGLQLWRFAPKTIVTVFSSIYLPALAAILLYRSFGVSSRPPWAKMLTLLFLAPAAYWIYGVSSLGSYHIYPVLVMAYLAFLILLSCVKLDWKKTMTRRSSVILSVIIGIFLAVNLLVMAPVLPYQLRSDIWKIVKQRTGIEVFRKNELQTQIPGNKETIKIVRDIPVDRSVCFWGNVMINGFMSDRNDFWIFPMCYDLADYLVMQRGALYYPFAAQNIKDLDYKNTGLQARLDGDIYAGKVVSAQLVDEIKNDLVDNKHTHRVAYDTGHVLVLERIKRHKFYIPKSTVGLGW